MTQSVVSAYERGRRDPSMTMLRRLVDATGGRLVIEVADAPRMLERLREHRDELLAAFSDAGLEDVRVFGSVARGDDGPASDVDILVHLGPQADLVSLGSAANAAERILGRTVDVVPDSGLKDAARAAILGEAVPL